MLGFSIPLPELELLITYYITLTTPNTGFLLCLNTAHSYLAPPTPSRAPIFNLHRFFCFNWVHRSVPFPQWCLAGGTKCVFHYQLVPPRTSNKYYCFVMPIKIKGQIPHVGAGVTFSGQWSLAFPVRQVSVCMNDSNFN